MKIGVPRERKSFEGRVGLIPEACAALISRGHRVFVEAGAGQRSGYADDAYRGAGAAILGNADELYEIAQIIVKVKEPIAEDLALLRRDQLLFCFLHLAANPELTDALCRIGLTAIAYETVEDQGRLPILEPMSDIAGRLAVQVGAHLLHQPQGGKGVLLGGLAGTERGQVVILGAGTAGTGAAVMAAGLGCNVTVFERRRDRLLAARRIGANVTTLYPHPEALRAAVLDADLLVGAVLITGRRAPRLVDAQTVAQMRPGSVIVDISVDQGGCIETTHPTTYEQPTYRVGEVTHFAVTNMPGAVPHTSSKALSAALVPYLDRLAQDDWRQFAPLRDGVNVEDGKVVHPALQSG